MPLKASYFTEHAQFKTLVATTGVVGGTLLDTFCNVHPTTAMACTVAGFIPRLLWFLVAMMALDMVTGVLASRNQGERVHSRRLGEGVKRKIGMAAVIASAIIIDGVFAENGVPTAHIFYRATTSWFIGVEALSLYENTDRMGIPIPALLRNAIERLLQKHGEALDRHTARSLDNQLGRERKARDA